MPDKKKMGRPEVSNPKAINKTIRFDRETLDKVEVYCQKKGLSVSELVRIAVLEYIK